MSVGQADGRFERICTEAGAEPIWLENLPWPEIAALRGVNGGMLLLPLGATEQHGPHLPINTDTLIAESVCWYASAKTNVPVFGTTSSAMLRTCTQTRLKPIFCCSSRPNWFGWRRCRMILTVPLRAYFLTRWPRPVSMELRGVLLLQLRNRANAFSVKSVTL